MHRRSKRRLRFVNVLSSDHLRRQRLTDFPIMIVLAREQKLPKHFGVVNFAYFLTLTTTAKLTQIDDCISL